MCCEHLLYIFMKVGNLLIFNRVLWTGVLYMVLFCEAHFTCLKKKSMLISIISLLCWELGFLKKGQLLQNLRHLLLLHKTLHPTKEIVSGIYQFMSCSINK